MSYSIQEKLIRVNSKTRPGKKITVKGVVIHWTANEANGADNEAHYNYFNKGSVYASAHYFVDSKGILRIIPENEMAYHVGARSYKTSKYGSYPNGTMIGVEMCVNGDGSFAETYKRAVWLVANILKRHKLGLDDLERHYDITGKSCPKMFTEDAYAKKYMGMTAAQAHAKFRKDVQAELSGTSAPAPTPSTSGTIVDKIQGKVLRENDKGPEVVLLQQGLIEAGFPFPKYGADGYYGKKGAETESNVRAFQKKYGLSVDGVAGPNTLRKLREVLLAKQEAARKAKEEAARRAAEAAKPKGKSHKVVSGDTLWGISRKYGVSVNDIKRINGLKSDTINPGDILYLSKVHVVQRGDTLWGISRKTGVSVPNLKKYNGLTSDVINPGDVLQLG